MSPRPDQLRLTSGRVRHPLSETRDTVARAVEASISPRTILLVAGTVAVAWALASIASVLLGLPGSPKMILPS